MIYASILYALFGFLVTQTSAIRIPLTVAGKEYQIDFNPETTSTNVAAQEFCINYAETLQLTRETLPNCVNPVQQHLNTQLAQLNAQLQSFPLTIGGAQYEIRFDPRVTSIDVAARDFCIQNGGNFGITQETLNNCITPVTNHLLGVLRPAQQQQQQQQQQPADMLTVTLDIGTSKYEVQFSPSQTTPQDAARSFCIRHAAALGVSEATLNNCVEPVVEHLVAAVQRHSTPVKPVAPPATQPVPDDVLRVTMTIGGNEFEIRFPPATTTAESAARDFCVKHAEILGVTRETFSDCLTPVMQYLQGEVNRLFPQKSEDLLIPIQIGKVVHQIRYNPDTQDADAVAREFCVTNAAAIGLDQDALPNCVLQVGGYVRANSVNISTAK